MKVSFTEKLSDLLLKVSRYFESFLITLMDRAQFRSGVCIIVYSLPHYFFSLKLHFRLLFQEVLYRVQIEHYLWMQISPGKVLYCTVLECTVLYFAVLHCTLLYCTVYCTVLYTVLYCTVLYCAVLYCAVLYCTELYCAGVYFPVLACTVLCCKVLYCAGVCCTLLYCTILYHCRDVCLSLFTVNRSLALPLTGILQNL